MNTPISKTLDSFQVYHSRPLFHLARTTKQAGRALHRRLKALISKYGIYYPPPSSLGDLRRVPLQSVPAALLNDGLVERIIVEGCFVSQTEITEESNPASTVQVVSNVENARLEELRARYEPSSTATPLSFPVASTSTGLGPGEITIPGWIRERAAEVLFEEDEEDEFDSIVDCCLQTLLEVSRLPAPFRLWVPSTDNSCQQIFAQY